MPTMSPASMTSRKTIRSVASIRLPSIALLCDQGPLGLVFVKIVKEAVGAGLQRPNIKADLAAGGNDLLVFEIVAFEFSWRRIEVLDRELHSFVCRDGQLRWCEFLLFEAQ